MIWNEKYECMSREELEEVQLSRLKAVVETVYEKVPFYRESFNKAGVKPGDIKSLGDLAKLPFITKSDLRESYPFKMFAVPMKDIVRIHSSSGTTGKPVVGGYTRNDIGTWAELMARTLVCVGVTEEDIIQNAYGYGLFTGGLGVHYGGERLGATVIPASGGNTKRQIMMLQDFGSTVLTATPSYIPYIAEVAAEMGIDVRELPVRIGVLGGRVEVVHQGRTRRHLLRIGHDVHRGHALVDGAVGSFGRVGWIAHQHVHEGFGRRLQHLDP